MTPAAIIPMHTPDEAIEELEFVTRELGSKVGMFGSGMFRKIPAAAGVDPDVARLSSWYDVLALDSEYDYDPVWAKCEELGILVFIHPQSTPDLAKRFKGNGWLANTIGNPLDTTIALSHLIFEGTLDKFPGLKICSAHGGGFLPSYAPRSDNSLRVAPDMDTGVKLKKKPTEYLRTMYYDTLVFTSEALRHLAAEVGVSQLVIGTDHPIPWQDKSVDHILNTPGFTDDERRAMLGETAAKLLRIPL